MDRKWVYLFDELEAAVTHGGDAWAGQDHAGEVEWVGRGDAHALAAALAAALRRRAGLARRDAAHWIYPRTPADAELVVFEGRDQRREDSDDQHG